MNFAKLLILFLSLSVALNSCSSMGEAGKVLRNEKRNTTDEFLIKKNEPLIQPPDFEKIPEPGSVEKKAELEQNNLEKILKTTRSKSRTTKMQSSSTEESILNQIKK
jgi:hypothetical protein